MQRIARRVCIYAGAAALWVTTVAAATIPVGYVSWDVNFPGNAGQFDITNLSGPNALPPSFPILTTVNLSSLSLVVQFVGGGSTTEPAGYFSLAPDGESLNGTAIPIGGTNPQPVSATLTGLFSPTTISVSGMGTVNISPNFTVTVSDSPNLVDGDFGIIYATTVATSGTPEPGTWILLALGLFGLVMARSIKTWSIKSAWKRGASATVSGLVLILCLAVGPAAFGQVVLPANTTPSSGVAGVNNVSVTASGVPSGTVLPANVVVTFATTCGGSAVATEAANSVRNILGSVDRINFNLPLSLTTGTYFVQVSDSTAGDADFTSTDCSAVQVTASSAVLNACVAGSSMGVLLPSGGAPGNVTAYVPKGYWSGSTTGVFVKNIEGSLVAGTTVPTAHITNSCSSNPATGQTVCVANNTDVYLITGTTLNTTLTSGSNTTTTFSGGTCENCGVALNANNNTAVINMGLTGSPTTSGVQILNLNTNTFSAPFPTTKQVSENISVDPTRSLILSANEGENYMLLQIQTDGSLKEFDSTFTSGFEDDSSAEDCSTGVAIAPGEFTNSVQLVNLNGLTLTTSPYTAPNTATTLSTTVYSFAAGLSGSAVAQGSGHLAVVTGEFGGDTFAVLKLPSTPGTGTPALVDYAIAQIPTSTQCGGTFSAGFDPHTITAYTSPNGAGDAMAVFAGYSGSVPVCLAVVDMTTVINSTLSPRGVGGYGAHEINPASLPAGAVTFFTLP